MTVIEYIQEQIGTIGLRIRDLHKRIQDIELKARLLSPPITLTEKDQYGNISSITYQRDDGSLIAKSVLTYDAGIHANNTPVYQRTVTHYRPNGSIFRVETYQIREQNDSTIKETRTNVTNS